MGRRSGGAKGGSGTPLGVAIPTDSASWATWSDQRRAASARTCQNVLETLGLISGRPAESSADAQKWWDSLTDTERWTAIDEGRELLSMLGLDADSTADFLDRWGRPRTSGA